MRFMGHENLWLNRNLSLVLIERLLGSFSNTCDEEPFTTTNQGYHAAHAPSPRMAHTPTQPPMHAAHARPLEQ